MLADPTVSSTVSVAGTVIPVRSALVVVAELVTRQDGRSAPRVGQDPNVSEGIGVVRRVDVQRRAVTFRVVVDDKRVGRVAGAGRVTVGLGVLKRGNSVLFECGLEGESVLEGLSLAEPGVFSRDDPSSSTVVNLQQIAVSRWGVHRAMYRVRTS